jgi:L-lactate utilization protein LutB
MTGNLRINVTLRRVHVTIVTVEKQEVFQHSKCVCRIILTSVACLAVPIFFFILSHKRHNFQGKKSYSS